VLAGDLRPDVGGVVAGIALSQSGDGLGEAREELIVDRVLDEEPRPGEADLPRAAALADAAGGETDAGGARLAGGGSWEEHVPLREPSSDRKLLEMVATPRLIALGTPVDQVAIELSALTDAHRQGVLLRAEGEERRERRAEAVRQVRASLEHSMRIEVQVLLPSITSPPSIA